MWNTNFEKAVAYGAYKELERLLKDSDGQGHLPPGFKADVSGQSLTITLPNMIVEREKGWNGNGTIKKKATQNLYGYATWCLFIKRLAKFNQAKAILVILKDVWEEVMKSNDKVDANQVEAELVRLDPELANYIQTLKEQDGPKREEKTPRQAYNLSGTILLNFHNQQKAAA